MEPKVPISNDRKLQKIITIENYSCAFVAIKVIQKMQSIYMNGMKQILYSVLFSLC